MKTPNTRSNLLLVARWMAIVTAFGALSNVQALDPVVSNVSASQRLGTEFVDITYDVADPDSANLTITILGSYNGGASYTIPIRTLSGDFGTGVAPGTGKYVEWNAEVDWDGQYTEQCRIRVVASDLDPQGFVTIPTESFIRGDVKNDTGSTSDELPTNSVFISAFEIEKTEVTGALWNAVVQAPTSSGYEWLTSGSYWAPDHPVQNVSWYDVVRWCNARSEMDGLEPVYYTDPGFTNIYKVGDVVPYAKWTANGYRLPTEAEWEKAARGGLPSSRFPWGGTITHNQANYYSAGAWDYDISLTSGYHPVYGANTSPVGSFPPNGYNLFDMSGNVYEWCWDWYDSGWYNNPASTNSDTRGPSTGTDRIVRGGSWAQYPNEFYAFGSRCANRYDFNPTADVNWLGFRCARGL